MGDNIGLITARSNKADDCSHFFISDCMSEAKCGERTTQSAIFPLFTYSNNFIENNKVRIPNLNSKIVSSISALLKLPLVEHNTDKSNDGFTPIDLLDYIYAVLYSPKYREKYKEFLKIDFPRVPYPTDKETFWKLVEIGSKLRECHPVTTFILYMLFLLIVIFILLLSIFFRYASLLLRIMLYQSVTTFILYMLFLLIVIFILLLSIFFHIQIVCYG